jgi:hypothetical protein
VAHGGKRNTEVISSGKKADDDDDGNDDDVSACIPDFILNRHTSQRTINLRHVNLLNLHFIIIINYHCHQNGQINYWSS